MALANSYPLEVTLVGAALVVILLAVLLVMNMRYREQRAQVNRAIQFEQAMKRAYGDSYRSPDVVEILASCMSSEPCEFRK